MSKPTGANRRDQLLEAAAACFYREGFNAASMRTIAEEAGMRTASIYYHFDSKDALLVAVHETALERIRQATSAAVKRSEERRVGKECRSRGSPDH